jgi:hypothetical protein
MGDRFRPGFHTTSAESGTQKNVKTKQLKRPTRRRVLLPSWVVEGLRLFRRFPHSNVLGDIVKQHSDQTRRSSDGKKERSKTITSQETDCRHPAGRDGRIEKYQHGSVVELVKKGAFGITRAENEFAWKSNYDIRSGLSAYINTMRKRGESR